MIDIKKLRDNVEGIESSLSKRGYKLDKSSFKSLDKISIPEFPFDGKFLIKRGIQEGKKIGTILSEAKKIWVKNNFYLSSNDLEKIIKKYHF